MLFSEPKIPQSLRTASEKPARCAFQCSSASRKFLNRSIRSQRAKSQRVSVLFSEPKIPQFRLAAQRHRSEQFQCSSASRKFLNCPSNERVLPHHGRFSALQRAENSSISVRSIRASMRLRFSALQRAENSSIRPESSSDARISACFSALQRAENSSIEIAPRTPHMPVSFSALQRAENSSI